MKSVIPDSKEHWLKLRSNNVNSTEVSAIFGINPYMTRFELWHSKKNKSLGEITENERMKWGSRLQDSIAYGIGEDNDWKIQPMKEYIYDEELQVGSSFDFKIVEPHKAILEIKNVDSLIYRDKWIEDESGIQPPEHIDLQVQLQMYCADIERAYIGVLVGGNEVKLIERTRDEYVIKEALEAIERFWDSIEKNREPKPDFEADAEFIVKLHNKANEGSVLNVCGNDRVNELVLHYKQLQDEIKKYELRKDAVKAELLTMIGPNEKVVGDLFSISAGIVKGSSYVVDRKDYRNFKINWKKVK